jgi:hypothetical protein
VLFGLAHRRIEALGQLPDALGAGTGLIEVEVDRGTNVELHRRLAELVGEVIRPFA